MADLPACLLLCADGLVDSGGFGIGCMAVVGGTLGPLLGEAACGEAARKSAPYDALHPRVSISVAPAATKQETCSFVNSIPPHFDIGLYIAKHHAVPVFIIPYRQFNSMISMVYTADSNRLAFAFYIDSSLHQITDPRVTPLESS